MTSYWQLLKDPRWQKVRLKKLEAAEWKCEACYDADTTLSVHHKRYVKGQQPWEYEPHELVVLCQPCHEVEHESKDKRSDLISHLHQDGPASATDFYAVGAGYVSIQTNDEAMQDSALRFWRESPYQFESGRFLAGVVLRLDPTMPGMKKLAEAFSSDEVGPLRVELAALFSKHGIICAGRG